MFRVPEHRRVTTGIAASSAADGNNGCFIIKHGDVRLFVIASDGGGWEHVSVTIPGVNRCPTWEEMCRVVAAFWDKDDCIVQFHPPKSEHVNNHPYCLHLWRPIGHNIPTPPTMMVGIKISGASNGPEA